MTLTIVRGHPGHFYISRCEIANVYAGLFGLSFQFYQVGKTENAPKSALGKSWFKIWLVDGYQIGQGRQLLFSPRLVHLDHVCGPRCLASFREG